MARSITTRSTNPKIMDDNIKILDDALGNVSAESIPYDNTDSGLTADDVQEAIDEISRGKIQITADGVKTYGELLDALVALVDFSKIRNTTSFIFNDGARDYIFQIHFYRSDTNIQFSRVTLGGSDPSYVIRLENVRLDTTSSTAFELNGSTYSDNTDNVVPENNTITLIY